MIYWSIPKYRLLRGYWWERRSEEFVQLAWLAGEAYSWEKKSMIVIFVVPTLSGDLPEVAGAIYLPPASQSDIYRAAQKTPVAIGLIDGFFDRVPAVWHKEILWAMTQGIYVFGSASRGSPQSC